MIQEEHDKIARACRANPKTMEILQEALAWEDGANPERRKYGFSWYDVHASPQQLNHMVSQKLLDVVTSTNSSTSYKLHDPTEVEHALLLLKDIGQVQRIEEKKVGELPPDLFSPIVGLDYLKDLFRKSLTAPKPVHVLLVGPKASSKSLFLSEIGERLPGARFVVAGSASKAGIEDYVLDYRPNYLLLDELDKMSTKDFSVLYSLLEFGMVTRMKKRMLEQDRLDIRVYAAANRLDTIPVEIQSRFWVQKLPEYDEDTFRRVVIGFLTMREGVAQDLAEYIADAIKGRTKDPRQARHIARLARTREEIDAKVSDPYHQW